MRGGSVPLILRPLGEEYQLLGEAYVNGIMHGEAVEQAKSTGMEERVFVIR